MSPEIQRDKSDVSDNKLIVVFHIENKITFIKTFTFIKAFTTTFTSFKQCFCGMWKELISGRSGNNIASAFNLTF